MSLNSKEDVIEYLKIVKKKADNWFTSHQSQFYRQSQFYIPLDIDGIIYTIEDFGDYIITKEASPEAPQEEISDEHIPWPRVEEEKPVELKIGDIVRVKGLNGPRMSIIVGAYEGEPWIDCVYFSEIQGEWKTYYFPPDLLERIS